jgi:hypothetical protein
MDCARTLNGNLLPIKMNPKTIFLLGIEL